MNKKKLEKIVTDKVKLASNFIISVQMYENLATRKRQHSAEKFVIIQWYFQSYTGTLKYKFELEATNVDEIMHLIGLVINMSLK